MFLASAPQPTIRGLFAIVALLTLCFAAACTSSKPAATPVATETAVPPSPTPSPTPIPVPPPAPIDWQPCKDSSLQCATLQAPLNYADPLGEQVELALIRQPARDPAHRIGVLIVNYGGPGNTGIDRLRDRAAGYPAAIQNDFDLISFDPRGVKYSTPELLCQDDSAPPVPQVQPWPVTDQDWQDVETAAKNGLATTCETSGGDILPYLGTENVVRDLDRLRQALGEDKISFWGESYGTVIGQIYADEYPQHIRSMVLDGVVDPNLSGEDWAKDQALGFEGALQRFFAYCRSISCITSGIDPATALDDLIAQAKEHPIESGASHDATTIDIYQAMLQAMYSSGAWPNFAKFINEGLSGNGNEIVGLADAYAQPQANGTYDNWSEVNAAVNCVDRDFPRDPNAVKDIGMRLAAVAPHFGAPIIQGYGACTFWPVPAQPLHAGPAATAPPILLVASTGDPFAPYKEAVTVAKRMDSAVLLTYDGESHPSYLHGVSCVDDIVNAYLIDGTMPAPNTVCGSAGITPVPPVP